MAKDFIWAGTRDEIVGRLKDLMARVEAGEDVYAAFRVYKTDGSYDDIVIAPTPAEEDKLRAEMHEHFRNWQ